MWNTLKSILSSPYPEIKSKATSTWRNKILEAYSLLLKEEEREKLPKDVSMHLSFVLRSLLRNLAVA